MTDESKLDTDLRKGQAAEQLLANSVLVEAFDTMRADYLAAWETTGARDTDARERLWQAYQIVGKVRTHLSHVAAGGKMAQAQIDQVAKLGERKMTLGVV